MKKIVFLLMFVSVATHAGFGVQLGGLSPTEALDDNDNALALGANISFKFAKFRPEGGRLFPG